MDYVCYLIFYFSLVNSNNEVGIVFGIVREIVFRT